MNFGASKPQSGIVSKQRMASTRSLSSLCATAANPIVVSADMTRNSQGTQLYLKTWTSPRMTWSVCVNSECSHNKTMNASVYASLNIGACTVTRTCGSDEF